MSVSVFKRKACDADSAMNTKTLTKPLPSSQKVQPSYLNGDTVAASTPGWLENLKSAIHFLRNNAIGCEVFVRMMHDKPVSR